MAADPEEPPPILGSWTRLYALVLAGLAFWVLLFTILTQAYG
jgi:hypothetical protein